MTKYELLKKECLKREGWFPDDFVFLKRPSKRVPHLLRRISTGEYYRMLNDGGIYKDPS